MKKKVFVLILALFMLMPVSGVFAEEIRGFGELNKIDDSLMNNIKFYYTQDKNNINYENHTSVISDHDRSTHLTIGENRFNSNVPKYVISIFEEPIKINAISTSSSAKINFIEFYNSNDELIYRINELNIGLYEKDMLFLFEELTDVKKIAIYNEGNSIYLNEFHVYNTDSEAPMDLISLESVINVNSIKFNYNLPTDEDFSHVKIYQDDVLIADNVTDTSYTVENLDYGEQYNFKFTTVDETGNESVGVIETVSIPMPKLEEIQEVNAESSHDRIDLSWSLPETEYFEHVNIYRKSMSEVQTFSLLSVDAYDPLFETNGTYFNDLTVEEQTTYDYKLTTEFQGLESEGVTVQATTLVAPPPELGGQAFEEQSNGDYLVTWDTPETGEVRILVDGQEHIRVPGSDKQYLIPASDMKYSPLGEPLVGLQTIGENGEESEITQEESDVKLPFGINELITTSAGLMRVVGSLILLGLSFILVPKFIKMIKHSLNNKNRHERERTEREQRVSERAYREPREPRISTREGRTSTRETREYRKGE